MKTFVFYFVYLEDEQNLKCDCNRLFEMRRFALDSHLERHYEQQKIEKIILFSYWLQS